MVLLLGLVIVTLSSTVLELTSSVSYYSILTTLTMVASTAACSYLAVYNANNFSLRTVRMSAADTRCGVRSLL